MPRVTRKGQVTIPRQMRAMLSISSGDEVDFEKALTLRLNLTALYSAIEVSKEPISKDLDIHTPK